MEKRNIEVQQVVKELSKFRDTAQGKTLLLYWFGIMQDTVIVITLLGWHAHTLLSRLNVISGFTIFANILLDSHSCITIMH